MATCDYDEWNDIDLVTSCTLATSCRVTRPSLYLLELTQHSHIGWPQLILSDIICAFYCSRALFTVRVLAVTNAEDG